MASGHWWRTRNSWSHRGPTVHQFITVLQKPCVFTPVNSVCDKALSREKALQRTDSFIDCPFRSDMLAPFELIVFSLGGNHQKKFCMPASPSPPTNVHLGANIKRTLLEAMTNERQTKFSPLILLSWFGNPLKFLVIMQRKIDANCKQRN